MILSLGDFRDRVRRDLEALVAELKDVTGRNTPEEEQAWRNSLPQVSHMLSAPALAELQMYFGGRGQLSLEYPIPGSASWCDLVLLGSHNGVPSAVLVELKDWQTAHDRPGKVQGLVDRPTTGLTLHPSEQVRGYADYCRYYHSAVQDYRANVHGCVLFTRDTQKAAYVDGPNAELARHYPVFTPSENDVTTHIPAYLSSRLSESDGIFAGAFERGYYRQDRNFCRQLSAQITNAASTPFVLLDNQQYAFARCRDAVEGALFRSGQPRKTVVIIQGPPGSGKSVIAAHLWAWLIQEQRLRAGSVVVTTTSASQRSNWEHLFERLGRGGRGAIMPANRYAPTTTQELSRVMAATRPHPWRAEDWQANIEVLRQWKGSLRIPENHFLVSIVDEAHALINPEHVTGRVPAGWTIPCGPQAYHIMKSSVLTVFLLDGEQGFRDRENTTIADIRLWAAGMGAQVQDTVVLSDSQYRCAGSKEYVEWVDAMLAGRRGPAAEAWRRRSDRDEREQEVEPMAAEHAPKDRREGPFVFEVVNSPFDLDVELQAHVADGRSARLAASFSREWKTKKAPRPHDLPSDERDFFYRFPSPQGERVWSRVWNYVPKGSDYSWFIQGAPGSPISDDPLCEVGCPYAIRGFDYDYLGLIWQRDLVWRNERWELNLDAITETGLKDSIRAAKKARSADDPRYQHLLRKVKQAYRILLTRAVRGIYVWCEDEETAQHLKELCDFDRLP